MVDLSRIHSQKFWMEKGNHALLGVSDFEPIPDLTQQVIESQNSVGNPKKTCSTGDFLLEPNPPVNHRERIPSPSLCNLASTGTVKSTRASKEPHAGICLCHGIMDRITNNESMISWGRDRGPKPRALTPASGKNLNTHIISCVHPQLG